ncbi:MAG: hypothetical protein CVV56_08155 [Tenericutes bacterium HGW-Tenericutes-1]|jgi:hypothetical protein|nr:MAG: hypothetical protein CVV56_08155 [Tenericutes bacterium HGW-Tenericutes-1]
MNYKIQYNTQEERNVIVNKNLSLFLIEEQNITEGNFLVFSDLKPLELLLNDIRNNTDLIIFKQEGLL